MPTTYLLFGSNLGKREANIRQALQLFVEEGYELLQASHFYETQAWGYETQPDFLNLCAKVKPKLKPLELLELCKQIEQKIGRQERRKWQEREIDIDILYYGKQVIDLDELQIPHPRMIQRNFALTPLTEIAPQKKHPILKLTSEELLRLCTDKQSVIRLPLITEFS